MASDSTGTCIDILLAILLPPLGVFLKYGCQISMGFYTGINVIEFGSRWSSGSVLYSPFLATSPASFMLSMPSPNRQVEFEVGFLFV
ncbi:hypothetical protein GQ457_08G004550 [Hibiscus cannabinus]